MNPHTLDSQGLVPLHNRLSYDSALCCPILGISLLVGGLLAGYGEGALPMKDQANQ